MKQWTKKLGVKFLWSNIFNIAVTLGIYKLFGFNVAILAILASMSTDVGEILKYVVSAGEEK